MKAVPPKRKPESASLRHALHGLALPAGVLKALEKRGIYCTPAVSLEHQHLAKRYVMLGVESGGAVSDIGRACAVVSAEEDPVPWFQSLDSIAVNGRYAIFLAESLVRVENREFLPATSAFSEINPASARICAERQIARSGCTLSGLSL